MEPDMVGPGDEQDKARIRENVAKMQAKGAPDAEIESYLRDVEGLKPMQADPNAKLHADFKSGALQRRIKGQNEVGEAEADGGSGAARALGTVASLVKDIPGMEAAQAGARAGVRTLASKVGLGEPQSYSDALSDIRGAEDSAPAYTRIPARLAGSTLAMLATPIKNPAGLGAAFGGAQAALDADPNQGALERGVRGLVGAGVGAALGKGAQVVGTLGNAVLRRGGNEAAAVARNRMLAERAESARALYGAAMKEGQGATAIPKVQEFLQEEDIAPIVADLKSTRVHAATPEDSPEMLDAVYKVLSDRAGTLKGKLGALTPRGANLGRVAAKDVGAAQDALLDATDGPMPSYRKAVEDYAKRSADLEGFDTGNILAGKKVNSAQATGKNLSRQNRTATAFKDWMATATPSQREAAAEGAAGYARGEMGITKPLHSLRVAAKLGPIIDQASAPNALERALRAIVAGRGQPIAQLFGGDTP